MRIAMGRYAYSEFVHMIWDLRKKDVGEPGYEYGLENADWHNDPLPKDFARASERLP